MYVCLEHWSYNQAELWPSESHSPLYIPRNYTLEHNMNPCDPCTSLYSQYFKTCRKKNPQQNEQNWLSMSPRPQEEELVSPCFSDEQPGQPILLQLHLKVWGLMATHELTHRYSKVPTQGLDTVSKAICLALLPQRRVEQLGCATRSTELTGPAQAQHRPVRPSSVGSSEPVRNLLSWQRKGSRPTGFLGTGRHRKPWKTRLC